MHDLLHKTLVMHIAQGLLSAQSPDFKFVDLPNKKKEVVFADQAFAYANEIMKRFKELDQKAEEEMQKHE